MFSIKITKAKTSDSQQIKKLEDKIWDEEVVNKYDIPMFVSFGYVFVAKDKDKIIGAIVAYPTKQNEVYVCDWVVDKKYRKMKIGEKLYKKLIKSVGKRSVVSFVETNNAPSIKAHQKFGFKIVKKIKNSYDLNEGYRFFMRRKQNK